MLESVDWAATEIVVVEEIFYIFIIYPPVLAGGVTLMVTRPYIGVIVMLNEDFE